MTVEEKIKEAISSLNVQELFELMSGMVASVINGEEPEKTDLYIKFSVPTSIHDMVAKVCKKFDLNPEEVFSHMATDGFNSSIKGLTKMASSISEEHKEIKKEPVKDLIPGMEKISESFAKLGSLTKQLTDMQKAFENVSTGLNIGTNTTDSK